MSQKHKTLYRKTPRTLKDKIFGKGFVGIISKTLMFGAIGLACFAMLNALPVIFTAAPLSAVGAEIVTTLSLLSVGFGVTSVGVGQVAVRLDDQNKLRRSNKHKAAYTEYLEKESQGMSHEQKIEFFTQKRNENLESVKNWEKQSQRFKEKMSRLKHDIRKSLDGGPGQSSLADRQADIERAAERESAFRRCIP